jgi:segregation and condensation protein B
LLGEPATEAQPEAPADEVHLRAMLEAIIYITEEPLTVDQIAAAIEQPRERVVQVLQLLAEEYAKPERGVTIREVAGGYRMGTKPEHHEAIRTFVKRMKPPLKLSLAALETLAVIAYKQPITSPEIMEIRGVQGAGVIKTLLDRKLITPAGRKQVVGKPILYRTTKDFLVQFGLKDLAELPTLKEFEELRRLAFNEPEDVPPPPPPVDEAPPEAIPHPPDAPVAPAEPEGAPESATHDQQEASVQAPADERE